MTVGEATDRVQQLYSHGVRSDDDRLRPRLIYSKLKSARATIAAQSYYRHKEVADFNKQTLHKVPLVEVKAHENPDLPSFGCKYFKPEEQIPKPLSLEREEFLVTSQDSRTKISRTEMKRVQYKSSQKWTSNMDEYFIKNNRPYFIVDDAIKAVSITGMFEDPVAVEKYNFDQQEVVDCFDPLDVEFETDAKLIDRIIDLAYKEVVVQFSQRPEDKINDASEDRVYKSD